MMDIHYWNDDDTQAQPDRAHINALYGIQSVDDYLEEYSNSKERNQETTSMPDTEPAAFWKAEISSPEISAEELEELKQEAIRQYHALNFMPWETVGVNKYSILDEEHAHLIKHDENFCKLDQITNNRLRDVHPSSLSEDNSSLSDGGNNG